MNMSLATTIAAAAVFAAVGFTAQASAMPVSSPAAANAAGLAGVQAASGGIEKVHRRKRRHRHRHHYGYGALPFVFGFGVYPRYRSYYYPRYYGYAPYYRGYYGRRYPYGYGSSGQRLRDGFYNGYYHDEGR